MQKREMLLSFLFLLAISTLSVSLVMSGGGVLKNSTTVNECVKNCNMEYVNSIKQCNYDHRNVTYACINATKSALSECQPLKGQQKRDCMKAAVNASQECKANTTDTMQSCKKMILDKRKECVSSCRIDQDKDKIPDKFDTFTCCVGDTCFEANITDCRNQGGAVMECIPGKGKKLAPGTPQNYTIINATSQAGWLQNLTQAANATGIPNKTYVPGTYDCDDFADDMERNLTALGYNATYTVYWCYNSTGSPTIAHAVTDVHAPDGSLVFIEPQTGQVANLDFNGDGTVGARTHHENNRVLTDDNCEIEVYQDAASATAAGAPRD